MAVNVKDFGAVGNGSTNDTAAFNAAIAAAGNTEVYMPKGVYILNGNINISTDQTLRGEDGVILKINHPSNNGINITGQGGRVKNFTIGSDLSGRTGSGIFIDTNGGASLEGIHSLKHKHGVHSLGSFDIFRSIFDANISHGVYAIANTSPLNQVVFDHVNSNSNGGKGFFFEKGTKNGLGLRLINCTCADNLDDGMRIGGGIDDIWIHFLESSGNDGYGLYVESSSDVQITSPFVETSGKANIVIDGGHFCTINGGFIQQAESPTEGYGLYINSYDASIGNITIDGNAKAGIYLAPNASVVTITGVNCSNISSDQPYGIIFNTGNPVTIAGGYYDLSNVASYSGSLAGNVKIVAAIGLPDTNIGSGGGSGVTLPINLGTQVTANLAITHLNSGTNASTNTYWRGDGTWATPPVGGSGSGAMVLLDTKAASSSSTISFTGLTGSYRKYTVVIDDLVPATNGASLILRTSSNNGSSYSSTSGDYRWGRITKDDSTNNNASSGGGGNANSIQIGNSLSSTPFDGFAGEVSVYNPSSTSVYKKFLTKSGFINSGGSYILQEGVGGRNSTSAINALQFSLTSGNINSGTFKLYGIS